MQVEKDTRPEASFGHPPKARIPPLRGRSLGKTAACCLLLILAGCPDSEPQDDSESPPAPPPLAGVTIRLAVVDDPQLATAAERLRGEFNARYDAKFEVESIGREELAGAERLSADALICPCDQLAALAQRKLITPVPEHRRRFSSSEWADVFKLLKHREATWSGKVYGVPFGSPVFVCYYRADLLKKLGRRRPQTWPEYHELAELLAERPELAGAVGSESAANDGPAADTAWYGTIEPLGPGWAGQVLLARAAPYARHRDRFDTLFDQRTMEPMIAGPPFVRALEELVAVARLGSDPALQEKRLELDPALARAAFWQGQCGMALSWPSAAAALPAAKEIEVGFTELPGSTDVYDAGYRQWDKRPPREDPHVPLLGIAGRIGTVSSKSAHPDAAFELLFWLSGKPADSQSGGRSAPQVAASSPATTLFREAHLRSPEKWCEKSVPELAARSYGQVTKTALHRRQCLFPPRIPGRSQYLAALDDAVHRAIRGEQSPAEALREAAARWQEITEQLGIEAQKTAYGHSLGR